jgi:flagellar protein FlaH
MVTQETEAKKKMISSGNEELNSRLGGGIPAGSLVLIEGTSGAGKSVLAQQMIWGALQENFLVTLFTSENSVKSLVTQMESIDLDILDFLLLGKFKAHPMKLARLGEQAPYRLIQVIKCLEGRDIVVVDSFTAAIANSSTDVQTLNFFEEAKRLCAKGMTFIITLHSDAVEQDLISPIRSMCDAHLQLRTEQDGQRLVKTLQVSKVRGAGGVTGAIVGFEVEPGWGMRIIPISKARG